MNSLKRLIYLVIGIIAAAVFLFSGVKVFQYWRTAEKSKAATNDLISTAVTYNSSERDTSPSRAASEPTATPGSVQPGGSAAPGEETPIPTAAETAPISVDFNALHWMNPDIVAWIYSEDTPINYPVMKGDDNAEYLYKLTNGEYNEKGSLFIDAGNSADFSDWNTIIYGHNMLDKTMFGTLTDYQRQKFYDSHPCMYLITPEHQYRLDMIAGYTETTDANLYWIPTPEEWHTSLIQRALRFSNFQTPLDLTPEDRFVTLSTCAGDEADNRYVVIGVLRELG